MLCHLQTALCDIILKYCEITVVTAEQFPTCWKLSRVPTCWKLQIFHYFIIEIYAIYELFSGWEALRGLRPWFQSPWRNNSRTHICHLVFNVVFLLIDVCFFPMPTCSSFQLERFFSSVKSYISCCLLKKSHWCKEHRDLKFLYLAVRNSTYSYMHSNKSIS